MVGAYFISSLMQVLYEKSSMFAPTLDLKLFELMAYQLHSQQHLYVQYIFVTHFFLPYVSGLKK